VAAATLISLTRSRQRTTESKADPARADGSGDDNADDNPVTSTVRSLVAVQIEDRK
jgi:hypothetical protein